ncbi:DUF4167 domain-containing protein [Dongia sp.]|uniref:DUF4167 domain-containing protein n=1 Tax=Dongia sp. TaxID=1977262 RepID=UPI0035ADF719
MRPGNNNNRRGRNRGPRKPHGGMPNKSQSFDGGGSDTRVRGNVYQVLEKYLQLARDAGVAGDRVAAENFLQHADHYYRVITTMNDGQRPRVGGREISVADVNVQNVSQGLSAALYSGGPSQPNMTDGGSNPGPQQGNGGAQNFNGQNGNAGNGQGNNAQGDDGHSEDGQDGDQQGEGEGGNYQQRPQQGQGQNRDRDRNRQRREFRQNDGRQNEGQRDNRQSDNRQHDNRQNDGRQNDARQNDGRPNDGRPNDGRGGEFRDRGNSHQPAVTERQPEPVAAPVPAPVAVVADEQPDYPEHLLPPAAEAPAEAPRAARTPRPRQQRVRRPRAVEGEGEDGPEPAPVAEGSE